MIFTAKLSTDFGSGFSGFSDTCRSVIHSICYKNPLTALCGEKTYCAFVS